MVAAVRGGLSVREVARRYGVAPETIRRWVERARHKRLDRVDWSDRSSRPHRTRRTASQVEDLVLDLRRQLRERSTLGEYGALAIHRELQRRGVKACPSVRTIGRILERRGALDGRRRVRRAPPPKGWFLPEVAARKAEMDSFDTIEGLAIRGGPHLTILTGISLHGGLMAVWVARTVVSRTVVQALTGHWQAWGTPGYAMFDNDSRFLGPPHHKDTLGRVTRFCLHVGVAPVFMPPRETGFRATIESFNGLWQAKVWRRFEHRSLRTLRARSGRYVAAARRHRAARIDGAPSRRRFRHAPVDLGAPPSGRLYFLRRTDQKGRARLLGRKFPVDRRWTHRLVRAEVDLTAGRIAFFALRRREPEKQVLLRAVAYALPRRPWSG